MINPRLVVQQALGTFVVVGLILFGAAGTVRWTAAWVLLATLAVFVVAMMRWLLVHNPGLLVERLTAFHRRDQKAWDRVFFVGINLYMLVWLALMPLDAVRFAWSHVPPALKAVGMALVLLSYVLLFLTFRENSYLSPVVRLQRDRGQTVVSTGPYRCLRHPMYAAGGLFVVGTALWLGSWYGLGVAVTITAALAWRAVREERTLLIELAGYDAYLKRVKYRFIPYIW